MTFFAQLLERSGVVTGDRTIGARRDPPAPHASGPPRVALGVGADAFEPELREVHEERAVRSVGALDAFHDDAKSGNAAPREEVGGSHASERLTAPSAPALPSAESLDLRRAVPSPSDRRAPERTEGAELPPHEGDEAPAPTHHIAGIDVVGERTTPSTAPATPTASPESPARAGDALAQARAWTAPTPLPNDSWLRDDRVYARSTLPEPVANPEAFRRPAPVADVGVSELHVRIGTIEVVVEQPPAPPSPKAPSSAGVPGAAPASRRLARHHLRG